MIPGNHCRDNGFATPCNGCGDNGFATPCNGCGDNGFATPQTDLDKFVDLYKSFGIELKPVEVEKKIIIKMTANEQEKILGYSRLYTEIVFFLSGKFKNQGLWE